MLTPATLPGEGPSTRLAVSQTCGCSPEMFWFSPVNFSYVPCYGLKNPYVEALTSNVMVFGGEDFGR